MYTYQHSILPYKYIIYVTHTCFCVSVCHMIWSFPHHSYIHSVPTSLVFLTSTLPNLNPNPFEALVMDFLIWNLHIPVEYSLRTAYINPIITATSKGCFLWHHSILVSIVMLQIFEMKYNYIHASSKFSTTYFSRYQTSWERALFSVLFTSEFLASVIKERKILVMMLCLSYYMVSILVSNLKQGWCMHAHVGCGKIL